MAQDHHHHHNKQKNIKAAFLLNLSFTVIEIIGGLWTNSMAILSDAVHDLGDAISLEVPGIWNGTPTRNRMKSIPLAMPVFLFFPPC